MRDVPGRTPKYLVIRDDLIRRIRNGEFAPGDALPGQRHLSDEYGVSLMTLRQALDELCDQGVVEQLPGRGTYVRALPVPYSMGNLRSLADDLRAHGIEVRTRVLSREIVPAPADLTRRFRIPLDGPVLKLERIRVVRGTPLIHQLSYLPQPFADSLGDVDFERQELYAVLAERAGAVAAQAEETIAPVLMPEEIGGLLGLPAGQPAMRSERITRDADGRTLVVDFAVLAGNSVVIMNTREASGHQLSYAMGDDPLSA
ncbi:GntR family transcriptional regulator [Micromonospora narathiwatensis]|uniref:GntR family transcriptional regulator n=1 Tax=Micromonospora narathiwatensis TaxID=299146 RepID=A0A1A8ZQ92_9ACTN|nr:GntR family transcriptional regulator [Micromonospora narathiwatensis]SBT45997.1 GntR family transcriptional regulator [Micromonospora narathiwatensis]